MAEYQIYHNPRCSKSRQTLALMQENGVEPDMVLYLDQPPSAKELATVIKKLGIPVRGLMRKGETEFKDYHLSDTTLTDAELIQVMCDHPKLIERPIVISGDRAILGRPPENVLAIL